jgi:hypothetical protein
MRDTRNNKCTKKGFYSEGDCLAAGLGRLRDRRCDAPFLRAYKCPICFDWHLTKGGDRDIGNGKDMGCSQLTNKEDYNHGKR